MNSSCESRLAWRAPPFPSSESTLRRSSFRADLYFQQSWSGGRVLLHQADAAGSVFGAFLFVELGQGRKKFFGFVELALTAIGDGQLRASGVVVGIQRAGLFQERNGFINAVF